MIEDTHEVHIEKDKENDTYKINHPSVLLKSQKLVATGLAFFAFLTVVVWSLQLKNSINNPFDFETENNEVITETIQDKTSLCNGPDCEKEDSRTKDTDGDGLWDWDEVNLYHTSIYLEDTDSDGIFDKEEIDRGLGPNCPEGRDCFEESSSLSVMKSSGNIDDSETMSQTEMLNFLNQLENSEEDTGNVDNVASNEKAMQDLLDGKASAVNLREILSEAGMEGKFLDNLSDEELMEVYRDMIKQ